MRYVAVVILLAAAVASAKLPQSADTAAPTFEVASVKPNRTGAPGGSFVMPPGRFTATNIPLKVLITNAYQLSFFQVVGGPGCVGTDRFDIAAKAAGPISDTERRLMMRALLVERFRLTAHFETREKTIYIMTLARPDKQLGPGLKPRPECATSPVDTARDKPCPSGGSGRRDAIQIRAVTLTQLADGMISTLRGELVRDETGLPGAFDVEMSWRPETSTDPDDGRPSFVTAMREQLGLKLEPMRRPVEVLVVESIDRPTPD